jgi:cellobiose phosphorylase
MNCGYFDSANREYVITNPQTPVKWINYIGTRAFGGFVDHTGGALICCEDPALNRITKYIQQMPSSNFKGETLYIRIHHQDSYEVFSPFYTPTQTALDRFECRVGLGYSRICSLYKGIETEVTIFVPDGMKCEVRDIRIRNTGSEPLSLDVIPVVEYTHPDALKQLTNADWVPQTMQSKAVIEDGYTTLLQYPFMLRDFQVNYFTSNAAVSSFETDRKKFLGENEYGSFRAPLALENPTLSNYEALRGDNIGALLHELGDNQPGEERQIITLLGQAHDLAEAQPLIQAFRDPVQVKNELEKLSHFWDAYLSAFQVASPDENLDVMANIFNARQCFTTFTWSRYLSYYQLGLGARGIGMRDSSQDVLAVLAAVPQAARGMIERLLSFQKQDGSAMHQFNPLSGVGSCGDSAEMEDRYHFYSDDHLWLILAVCEYIKETGELEFLDRPIPFYEKDKSEQPLETAPILEHLLRGLDFTRNHTGSHGLPLLGFADWNDTVNLPKGAESFFTANLYGLALNALRSILKDDETLTHLEEMFNEMKTRVESSGWDGSWYLRYFDHLGQPVGTSTDEHTQIYLNGQTWPVLSGFASQERAESALQSVYDRLFTSNGIKISDPPFNGFDPAFGGITTFPPGVKENGGIFVHPNPWAMIAETKLRHGDRAYQYYQATNPAFRNDRIEEYECEPYVYAQNVISDGHPQFGLARNSWLSGASAWHYIAVTQYILGIRAELAGLRIDPCIPAQWEGFSVERRFRGEDVRVEVQNPEHVSSGIKKILVNGQAVNGNLVNAELLNAENLIQVWMG